MGIKYVGVDATGKEINMPKSEQPSPPTKWKKTVWHYCPHCMKKIVVKKGKTLKLYKFTTALMKKFDKENS